MFTNNSWHFVWHFVGGKKISTRKDKKYCFSSNQLSLVSINLKILMKEYSFWRGKKKGILSNDNFLCKTKGFWSDLNDQINKSLGICLSGTATHAHTHTHLYPPSTFSTVNCALNVCQNVSSFKCLGDLLLFIFLEWKTLFLEWKTSQSCHNGKAAKMCHINCYGNVQIRRQPQL